MKEVCRYGDPDADHSRCSEYACQYPPRVSSKELCAFCDYDALDMNGLMHHVRFKHPEKIRRPGTTIRVPL